MSLESDLYRKLLEKGAAYEGSEPPQTVGQDDPTVMVETVEHVDDEAHEKPLVLEKASSITVMNLFRNQEAHPIVLDLALLKKYGLEWLRWEFETLTHRIPQDFKTPNISDLNMEKVQACKALHLVDTFWLQWEVFSPCVLALSGHYADFSMMSPGTVPQAMVAVDIANRIREDVSFSDEIKKYLACVHQHDGYLVPLPPLDFVHVDTTFLPVDAEAIRKRWPKVRTTNDAPTGDTVEDEQLRRMFMAWQYLEESRAKLRAQLPVLQHV